MKFEDIPDYERFEAWKNQYGEWEVKLFDEYGEVVLHLSSESTDANEIENEALYLDVQYDDPGSMSWIRERLAHEITLEKSSVVDADYLTLYDDGKQAEHQHNHRHLDYNVMNGDSVKMTPV